LAVGVGASNGSAAAFEQLLSGISPDTGMVFVLAHNLDPAEAGRMRESLAQCTQMPVVDVDSSAGLRRDTVYLVGPVSDVSIDAGLSMTVKPTPDDVLGMNCLFAELADRFGARTIGIALCDNAADAGPGLNDIRDAGGLTVAQTPDGDACRELKQAIDEGLIDLVINVEFMPRALMRFAEHQSYTEGSALLAAIVANSDDAIISKTHDGKIVSWNAGAERIFGYTADEAMERSIELIIPPELRDEEKIILAKLGRGERIEHFETERFAKDGRRIDVSISVSPIREKSGRIVGASKVARDISERKHAEAVLREVNRRKDEYLAMLGHELRNPLAAIQSAGDVIKQAGDNPRLVQKASAILERQSSHMANLLDGVLDVSRITRGKLQVDVAPVDLVDLLGDVLAGGAQKAQREQVEICADIRDEPLEVLGDATRLTQVFGNLLDNALKFTEPGGSITISARARGDMVEVVVRDTGVGFPSENADLLFEAFNQGPQEYSRSRGGLGLGLALAKGLVELQGGTIDASSAGPDRGAAFTVRLPFSHGTASPDPAPAELGADSMRIVLIDDNDDLTQMLSRRLEMQGHDVRAADDADSGIALVKEHAPRIVLCDLGLPGEMNGFDVARALRNDPQTSHIRLVALSGYGRDADKEKGAQAGFDAHITKPVDFDTLEQRLRELTCVESSPNSK
jgi:PAS domain S-box-containing protein